MSDTGTSDTAEEPHPESPALERRSVVRNVIDLMTSQAITWALALGLTVVQPRYLGPEGQGQLRLAYSVWLMTDVLVALGTTTALTLAVARDRDAGLAMVRPIIELRALGYILGWGAVVVYLELTGAGRTLVLVTVLIGVVSMIESVAMTARAALIGLEQMRFPAIADVATKVVLVAAIIIALLAGGDVVTVASMTVVGAGLHAVLMVHFLRQFPFTRRRQSMRAVLRLSIGLMVADAALILYQQIDTVIMAILVGERPLGWYAAADQLFGSLLFVPTILMTTLFPVFGRLNVEDPERLRHMISRAIASVLLVTVPIGLGAIAVGRPLARLLFGDAFDGAGQVLMVMGVVLIFTAQTILLGQYAIATGHQRLWNVVMILAILATIPLDLVFVPWTDSQYGNGAIGGAMAYVVTESLMVVVGVVRFRSEILTPSLVPRILKTLAAGGLMLAAVWPFREHVLVLPIAVGAVAYSLAVWVLRAPGPEEREALAKVGGALRGFGRG